MYQARENTNTKRGRERHIIQKGFLEFVYELCNTSNSKFQNHNISLDRTADLQGKGHKLKQSATESTTITFRENCL